MRMSRRFAVAKLHSPSVTLRFGSVVGRFRPIARCFALFELARGFLDVPSFYDLIY
jgi:hypothetical protein